MSKIFKLSAIAVFSSVMLGCGGGSGGSSSSNSSGGDNTGNITSPDSALNHTWVLNYDDGMGVQFTDFIIIDDGKVLGLQSTDEAPALTGTATNNDASVSLSLQTPATQLNLSLDKTSDTYYTGASGTTQATLIKYGNDRSQDDLTGDWKTDAGYAFSIDEDGQFSSTHDHSGCTVTGSLTYKDNNVYLLSGEATGCINGELDGSFTGYGSVIVIQTILGTDLKAGQTKLIFSHDSVSGMSEKYQPLNLTMTASVQ